jgi:hypothetical protein
MSTPKPSNKAKEALTAEMNEGDVGFVFIIEASTPKQKIPRNEPDQVIAFLAPYLLEVSSIEFTQLCTK